MNKFWFILVVLLISACSVEDSIEPLEINVSYEGELVELTEVEFILENNTPLTQVEWVFNDNNYAGYSFSEYLVYGRNYLDVYVVDIYNRSSRLNLIFDAEPSPYIFRAVESVSHQDSNYVYNMAFHEDGFLAVGYYNDVGLSVFSLENGSLHLFAEPEDPVSKYTSSLGLSHEDSPGAYKVFWNDDLLFVIHIYNFKILIYSLDDDGITLVGENDLITSYELLFFDDKVVYASFQQNAFDLSRSVLIHSKKLDSNYILFGDNERLPGTGNMLTEPYHIVSIGNKIFVSSASFGAFSAFEYVGGDFLNIDFSVPSSIDSYVFLDNFMDKLLVVDGNKIQLYDLEGYSLSLVDEIVVDNDIRSFSTYGNELVFNAGIDLFLYEFDEEFVFLSERTGFSANEMILYDNYLFIKHGWGSERVSLHKRPS